MHEIRCSHCGKTFNIDEAGYADILKEVRDEAFDTGVVQSKRDGMYQGVYDSSPESEFGSRYLGRQPHVWSGGETTLTVMAVSIAARSLADVFAGYREELVPHAIINL